VTHRMPDDPHRRVRAFFRGRAAPLRRSVPDALVPLVVWARTLLASRNSFKVASSRHQMEVLLGGLPEYDLDEMTRRHVAFTQRRAEYRFHPDLVSDQQIDGLAHLVTARERGRGVLLSFMHYGHYDGSFLALKKAGVDTDAMVIPFLYAGIGTDWQRQHARLLRMGTTMHSVEGGSQVVRDLLADGRVVALASDVTSRTRVPFLGRDRLASFGAPRLAHEMGSPVVVMTFAWDGRRPRIVLHEPLEPESYADPTALFADILALQEEAVRAWPWSYELPQDRWVVWADDEAGADDEVGEAEAQAG
jgi:lauroyl/myristoyl acyltransferase